MPEAPKVMEEKLKTVIAAWDRLRSAKSFAKMTLDQFKAKVKPSFDARTTITDLEKDMTAALNRRDDADVVSNDAMQAVVKSVIGDPDEGEDGDLYEAMGYVRKSERKSGLKRASKPAPAK